MPSYYSVAGTGNLYFGGGAGPPGPPGPAGSGVASIVSVFNYIPPTYHAAILAGTLSASINLSPYIQNAFNDIGCRQLYIEQSPTAGVRALYNIGTQLTNPNDDLTIVGGTRATFKAIADLDTGADGRGAIIYSPNARLKVSALTFDMNSKTGNAIFLDRCTFPAFDLISVINSKAGYAGLRGGSILYPYASRVSVSGSGRVFDFQKGWELVSTTSYYGANDGLFLACKGFAAEGWRLCGGMTLIRCGIEAPLNQPALRNETRGPQTAAWVLGEEIGIIQTCNIDFIACYEELSAGTATPLRSFYCHDRAAHHIHSGEYFGQSSSLLNSVFSKIINMSRVSITGEPKVNRWYSIFDGAYPGAGDDFTLSPMLGDLDGDATNQFVAGTGVQPGEVNRGEGNWGDISLQPTGLQIAKPIQGIVIGVTPNGTPGDDAHKINLGQARGFKIGGNITVDATFLLNVGKNQQFSFEFSSNTVTLKDSVFNLVGTGDKTYAIGDLLLFQTDSVGVIYQVGGNGA